MDDTPSIGQFNPSFVIPNGTQVVLKEPRPTAEDATCEKPPGSVGVVKMCIRDSPLTTNDVIALHNAGVRPHVIDALQNPPVPVAAPPAVVPVYAPPPPRPVIITGPPYFRPGPPPCRPPHWHSRRRSRIGFSYHHHF